MDSGLYEMKKLLETPGRKAALMVAITPEDLKKLEAGEQVSLWNGAREYLVVMLKHDDEKYLPELQRLEA